MVANQTKPPESTRAKSQPDRFALAGCIARRLSQLDSEEQEALEPLLEDLGDVDLTGIHWAIPGGESGPGARPMDVVWIRSLVAQCIAQGTRPFVKQFGSNFCDAENGIGSHQTRPPAEYGPLTRRLKHRKGADLSEVPGVWPREFPR